MVPVRGIDSVHDTRQPRWSETSVYTGFRDVNEGERPVALGAWAAAPFCPCSTKSVDVDSRDCEVCETFCCSRCERWCSWEMGAAESPLCDDCAVWLGLHEVAS